MVKYATDVENAVQGFFAQEPFKEYQRYFNVHRVDVTSAESGADHPEDVPPTSKDTAFDATYNCAGIERLICVDGSKVDTVLSSSIGADQQDMVLVLVNDTEFGGSGGSIAVASLDPAVIELVLHEIGHSFGLLADEYDTQPPSCDNTVEPPEVNVTRETDRGLIKWNVGAGPPTGWIDPATPIPTISTDPGVPGLYEGAKYCPTGLFRPTFNSKMRTLVLGDNQTFRVAVPTPDTHSLLTTWYVDNSAVATDLAFTFNSATFGTGPHSVRVIVEDPTPKVRNDPENVLRDDRTWMVSVNAPTSTCFGVPATIVGTNGNNRLKGTSRDDVIVGLGGNDIINGKGGNDRICGGKGKDVIIGGRGNDFLDGGSGFDILSGGRGTDVCVNGEVTVGCP